MPVPLGVLDPLPAPALRSREFMKVSKLIELLTPHKDADVCIGWREDNGEVADQEICSVSVEIPVEANEEITVRIMV